MTAQICVQISVVSGVVPPNTNTFFLFFLIPKSITQNFVTTVLGKGPKLWHLPGSQAMDTTLEFKMGIFLGHKLRAPP